MSSRKPTDGHVHVRAGDVDESAVLDALAELTKEHGCWEAARILFTVQTPAPTAPLATDGAPRPVVAARSVTAQRALIAKRAHRRRHRALLALSRRWAR